MSFLPLIGRSVEDTYLEERPRQEGLRRQTEAQVRIPGTRQVHSLFMSFFYHMNKHRCILNICTWTS